MPTLEVRLRAQSLNSQKVFSLCSCTKSLVGLSSLHFQTVLCASNLTQNSFLNLVFKPALFFCSQPHPLSPCLIQLNGSCLQTVRPVLEGHTLNLIFNARLSHFTQLRNVLGTCCLMPYLFFYLSVQCLKNVGFSSCVRPWISRLSLFSFACIMDNFFL